MAKVGIGVDDGPPPRGAIVLALRHLEVVTAIRSAFVRGLHLGRPPTTASLAREHGCSEATARSILTGRSWPNPSWDPRIYTERVRQPIGRTLTADVVANIRRDFKRSLLNGAERVTADALGAKYGCTGTMIGLILSGRNWPDPSWDGTLYTSRPPVIPPHVRRIRALALKGLTYTQIMERLDLSRQVVRDACSSVTYPDPTFKPVVYTGDDVRTDAARLPRLRKALETSSSLSQAALMANVMLATARRLCREHRLKPKLDRNTKRLTTEDRRSIDRLLGQSVSMQEIARLIGRSFSSVYYHVHKRIDPSEYKRRLSPEKIRAVAKLRRRGWSQNAIADKLDISQSTISRLLAGLASLAAESKKLKA